MVPLAKAQDEINYLRNGAKEKIAFLAHLTNTFNPNYGSIKYDDNNYYLTIYYKEKTGDGEFIHTQIKLGKGNSILTFSSITQIYDNDIVPSFFALLTSMQAILEIARENNPEQYNKQLQELRNYLGIEPNEWNGADWALFLINFDYACQSVSNN